MYARRFDGGDREDKSIGAGSRETLPASSGIAWIDCYYTDTLLVDLVRREVLLDTLVQCFFSVAFVLRKTLRCRELDNTVGEFYWKCYYYLNAPLCGILVECAVLYSIYLRE